MKGRAILAIVALALPALVACGGEAPTSTPAVAEYQEVTLSSMDGFRLSERLFGEGESAVVLAHMFPSDQESWWVFAHGTDMLKGATGQRVEDAILGFLKRQ